MQQQKQKGWNEGTIKKRTNELKERSADWKTLNTMGRFRKASTIYTLEKLKMVLFQKGLEIMKGKW